MITTPTLTFFVGVLKKYIKEFKDIILSAIFINTLGLITPLMIKTLKHALEQMILDCVLRAQDLI